jgi:hypothetical protein
VARAVAEDLEAIFPDEPSAPPLATLRLRDRRGRDSRPSRGRAAVGYTGTVGALAAATLAGVSAGAMIGRSQAPSEQSTQLPAQAQAQSLPSPGPLLPSGPLHAPLPRVLVAEAEPAHPPQRAKLHKTVVRRPMSQHHWAHRVTRGPSVMEADARLRRSYDAARHAGVSSTVLTDYHDQWEALRHRAPREPRLVVARYDAMAGELDQLAARHQAEETRSHSGPWRTLKTQIASLWR